MRARNWRKYRSIAASWPPSAWPTCWRNCARELARTGRKSCRRSKLDRRIGPFAYLAPGLGIAGGNLERDLATVCRLAEAHGSDAGVVKAWRHNSRHRRDWAVRTIREAVLGWNPQAEIAVWGLAYKENTHSVKNSPSLATIRQSEGVP